MYSYMKHHFSFEHMNPVETATEFVFPEDLPEEIKQIAEQYAEQQVESLMHEFVMRLLQYLTDNSNPTMALNALLAHYQFDFSRINGKKTLTGVAAEMGVSKQLLNWHKNNVEKKLKRALN